MCKCSGHLNRNTGCRVTAILMNGVILPIGGASAVEGLLSTGPTPSSFRERKKNFLVDVHIGPHCNRLKGSSLPQCFMVIFATNDFRISDLMS